MNEMNVYYTGKILQVIVYLHIELTFTYEFKKRVNIKVNKRVNIKSWHEKNLKPVLNCRCNGLVACIIQVAQIPFPWCTIKLLQALGSKMKVN